MRNKAFRRQGGCMMRMCRGRGKTVRDEGDLCISACCTADLPMFVVTWMSPIITDKLPNPVVAAQAEMYATRHSVSEAIVLIAQESLMFVNRCAALAWTWNSTTHVILLNSVPSSPTRSIIEGDQWSNVPNRGHRPVQHYALHSVRASRSTQMQVTCASQEHHILMICRDELR